MITNWIGTHMVVTFAAIAVQAEVSASRISSRSSMCPVPVCVLARFKGHRQSATKSRGLAK